MPLPPSPRAPSEAPTEGLEGEEEAAHTAAKVAGGDWGPVFVYGMLLAAPAWGKLIGRVPSMRTAMIKGFERRAVQGTHFAGLMSKGDGITVGMAVTGLRPAERRLMDAVVDDGFSLITTKAKYVDVPDSAWFECTTYVWRENLNDALSDVGVHFLLPLRHVDFKLLITEEKALVEEATKAIQSVAAAASRQEDIVPEMVLVTIGEKSPVRVEIGCPGGMTMALDTEMKLNELEKLPLFFSSKLKAIQGIQRVVTKNAPECLPIRDVRVSGDWDYDEFQLTTMNDFVGLCGDMRERYRCSKTDDDTLKDLAMARRRREPQDGEGGNMVYKSEDEEEEQAGEE